jgi:hypothetical protein
VAPDIGGASAEWRPGVGVSSVYERAAEAGGSLRALAAPTGGLVEPRLPLQLYIWIYSAWETELMLKSGIRNAGVAVREKNSSPHSREKLGTVSEACVNRFRRSIGLSL